MAFVRGISQSAMSLYRYCPYAYYLKYKFKLEPMMWEDIYLRTGGLVHDVIDKYYKNHYLETDNPEKILAETYDILSRIWDMTLPSEMYMRAYICLQNHAIFESGVNVVPKSEVKIGAEGYYGIIDYIDLENNKVIDWKTGAYATVSYEYRMQAYIYKKLYESKFDKKMDYFYFLFLGCNEWRKVKFDTPKQIAVGQDVENFKNQINNSWSNNDFPKKPRLENGCLNCDYKYYCRVCEQ